MEQFIGLQMLMSIIRLPCYEMYWSKEFRVDCIADMVSLKRYETLKRYLHCIDNITRNVNATKLFKVEPILDALRKNCIKIDEQIIPAKTKRSDIRQYMTKKIHDGDSRISFEQSAQESFTTFSYMYGLGVLEHRHVAQMM